MVSKRTRSSLGCAALLLCASSALAAEPDATDKETARTLMAQGREARDRDDLKTALSRFVAADAIMHVPTTTLEVAKSQAALGQLVEARDTLHRILRDASTPDEPAPFARAREAATALDQELLQRIPTLRVILSGAREGSPRVQVDGERVPDLALASGYRLNPGGHRVVADTENAHAEQRIQLGEAEAQELTLELVPNGSPKSGAGGTKQDTPNAPTGSTSRVPIVPVMLGGVSLAALGAGVSFGLVGRSRKHELQQTCSPNCTSAAVGRVRTMYTFANVSFSVSIAAAASAFVWYALSPSSTERPASARAAPLKLQDFRLEVATVPTGLGLGLRASF